MDINLKFGEAEPLTPEEIEYFDSQEKMDKLPEKIKILWGNKANHCETQLGKTFTLFIQEHHDKDWKGYWSLMYELEGETPPLMPQAGEDTRCFLCSMGKTYMEAENELIDRLERAKGYWEESKD